MSRRVSLREFQEYLSHRLAGAVTGVNAASLLGVQAGKSRWLMDLSISGEVISTLPSLTPVPLTRPSFLGLANIRGNLHAVTDFPAFIGEEPISLHNSGIRLLLVGTRFGNNVALLVSGLLGLKKPTDFKVKPPATEKPWNAGLFIDNDGGKWHRLDLAALLADPDFMNIVA
ncbi:MAG: chemotaxis protein CheW [Zoogloeaceae bacterium]|jgi:twitching motility protein PilI|nr:chemotaxis protein CheW [Zoogloeaceae bacterium]